MKQRFDTIVLGATYYGLGYAEAHPDCLVLEQMQTVGGDFHHSLHPVHLSDDAKTNMECGLGRMMCEHGVWTKQGFDLLKASPVLHKYVVGMMQNGLSILMDVQIISVERKKTCFEVVFYSSEGICRVEADRIIDATVNGEFSPQSRKCIRKSLNIFTVALHPDFDEKLAGVCDCSIEQGFLENEKLVCFNVSDDRDITGAYEDMIMAWKKAFPDGEEKILMVADDLDTVYSVAEGEEPGYFAMRIDDPVETFLKGAAAK